MVFRSCSIKNEHEYLIKAIVSSYCPDDEFKEEIKKDLKLDLGKAFCNHLRSGRLKKEEFEQIEKTIKKSL